MYGSNVCPVRIRSSKPTNGPSPKHGLGRNLQIQAFSTALRRCLCPWRWMTKASCTGVFTRSAIQRSCTGSGIPIPRLVSKLREAYDFVVIDTPPVLCASEAMVMAKAADGTYHEGED